MGATVVQVQNALDPQGTGKVANIIKQEKISATADLYTVQGITLNPGRLRKIQVLSSRTAAQAASDIRTGLAREY